ncbi:hypothetical protein COW81_01990 [Candidatus Campbellbacteria bacterium CG22_combo_CG10-13_8_21_14_all_36_13]|uniref:HTH HARE-type domain-containing protein n=1 Tax=Candidatus Campbellbacteria bacterium CG22_combo_CG10-13_8_21_14_all_36_13 TaxID=1974529 RepID=A0A2H0DY75_9BACT|nr:MAG: hypothetical protein COW81_01990 [Candidatus Campbellbacteria bacterium CG22_combo_CG10-13_8_21_14_all_36_13]
MSVFSFKPNQITKKLVKELPDRAQDVIIRRYGLTDGGNIMTLESIGGMYGITRERVRQIENHALNKIRQSSLMNEHQAVFDEIKEKLESLGYIITEEDLLYSLSPKTNLHNHITFLLVIGNPFVKEKEDKHFKHRWFVDKKIADVVHDSLHKVHDLFFDDALVSEDEIIKSFKKIIGSSVQISDDEILRRWLSLSKVIAPNPLGEWGRATSPNVRVKGMRDYAYLVIRQHGSPMHFTEVTKKIQKLFGKNAHVATTHNELIKDPRFVLVGRGLYALKSWGYMNGIVKDVIVQILEKYGSLSKDEIMEHVLRERYVKPNTIIVNLQDTKTFKKNKEGRYTLA